MFVVNTTGERVATSVVRQVVGDVERAVVKLVAGRKRVVAKRNVIARAVPDIHCWEEVAGSATIFVLLVITHNEVVVHAVVDVPVPLTHDGAGVVVDDVTGILERHRLHDCTAVTLAQRVGVGNQHIVIRIVVRVAQRKAVALGKVVVQANDELVGVGFVVVIFKSAGLIAQGIAQEIAQVNHVAVLYAGDLVASLGIGRVGCEPGLRWFRTAYLFVVGKKEQFVFDQWTTNAEAVDVLFEFTYGYVSAVYGCAVEGVAVVAPERVHRTFKFVVATAGNSVDACTHKVGLAHVVRSRVHLYFLDGVERNGSRVGTATCGCFGSETETVVELRTVNRKVVQTAVLTTKRTAIAEGRVLGDFRDGTAADNRHLCDDPFGVRSCSTIAIRRKYVVLRGNNSSLFQGRGSLLQVDFDVGCGTKARVEVLARLGFVTRVADFYFEWSANTNTGDDIAASYVGRCAIA